RAGLLGVGQQVVAAVLLALLACRLGGLVGAEHVDQRLVLGGRRLPLLRPGLFLQELVDELVVGGLQRGGRRLRGGRLELRRDLGVLRLRLALRPFIRQRRQRHLAAALLRGRPGRSRLGRRFFLLRLARGVRRLLALGLLGGRLVDLLRLADLVELGLLVVRAHHLVFPLQRLADAGFVFAA